MKNLDLELALCRQKIDTIDQKLYTLFIERIKISDNVAIIKSIQSRSRSFFRVFREIEVIMNAHNALKDYYPKSFCVHIWRLFISALLNNERQFQIVSANSHCYWLAREYFGSFIKNTIVNSSIESIEKLIEHQFDVSCIPFPSFNDKEKWWLRLLNNNMKIFAIYPFVKEDTNYPVTFIADIDLEPTGNDSTLLVIGQNLDPINISNKFSYKIIDEHLQYKLLLVDGFVKDYNHDAAHIIGAFAKPI